MNGQAGAAAAYQGQHLDTNVDTSVHCCSGETGSSLKLPVTDLLFHSWRACYPPDWITGHDSSLPRPAATWGCLHNRPTCFAVDSWLGWINICGQTDTSSPLCGTKSLCLPPPNDCVTAFFFKNGDGTLEKNIILAYSFSDKCALRANECAVSPLARRTVEFYTEKNGADGWSCWWRRFTHPERQSFATRAADAAAAAAVLTLNWH